MLTLEKDTAEDRKKQIGYDNWHWLTDLELPKDRMHVLCHAPLSHVPLIRSTGSGRLSRFHVCTNSDGTGHWPPLSAALAIGATPRLRARTKLPYAETLVCEHPAHDKNEQISQILPGLSSGTCFPNIAWCSVGSEWRMRKSLGAGQARPDTISAAGSTVPNPGLADAFHLRGSNKGRVLLPTLHQCSR